MRLFVSDCLKSMLNRRTIGILSLTINLTITTPVSAQIFYPPTPDPPRIQFLKKLHSEADIRRKPGWFLRFLFGRQLQNQWLRKALIRPYSVTFLNGNLLVSDSRSDSYWKFDFQERTLNLAADAPRQAGIQASLGLAVDNQDRIIVTDTIRKELLIFASEGRLTARYGRGILERPAGVTVHGDTAFVADPGKSQIVAFSISDGGYRIVVGGDGKELSPLGGPTNVAIARDGSLFISETLRGRVSRFGRDGTLISIVGDLGTRIGSFGAPKGLAVDKEGRLYVADARYEHIQVFDDQGRVLVVFGRTGDPESDIFLPAGLSVDYESVPYWQQFAAEGFELEYIIAAVGQYEPASVYIYGFGRMTGVEYPDDIPPQ